MNVQASMHFSRMPTVGLLTVSNSIPGEGPASRGVGLHPGGSASEVGSKSRGRGVCICGGLGKSPFPVNRMTDRCKNITLPQTSFAGGN